jgi:ectoine hydroxylase-related dioxygenase (phytanoyl-CoA dioxygenase family)
MTNDLKVDVAGFSERGFTVVGPLAGAETLAELRDEYDRIMRREVDCGPLNRELGNLTRQAMHPDLYRPLFKHNEALERARPIAAALLGTDTPEFFFSMLIFKPPGHAHTTPWHQDLGYLQRPIAPAGIDAPKQALVQFWMALDDVDETMGCMEFLPGVHREPLQPHYVFSGDPEDDHRLIAIEDRVLPDLPDPVRCPLSAGWATIHDYNTPHYTGPNRSQRPRRAYIFSFKNAEVVAEFNKRHPMASNRPKGIAA